MNDLGINQKIDVKMSICPKISNIQNEQIYPAILSQSFCLEPMDETFCDNGFENDSNFYNNFEEKSLKNSQEYDQFSSLLSQTSSFLNKSSISYTQTQSLDSFYLQNESKSIINLSLLEFEEQIDQMIGKGENVFSTFVSQDL